MKLDIPEDKLNQILQIMQQAPVAHLVVDPLLKLIIAQANDKKIQSLAYPPEKPAEETPPQSSDEGPRNPSPAA